MTTYTSPSDLMRACSIIVPPHAEYLGGNDKVEHWARCARVSRRTLTRRVRAATGRSADDYIRLARFLPALVDLCAGRKLTDTANAHDYPDSFTLSDVCLRFTGLRPSDVRGMDWCELARERFGVRSNRQNAQLTVPQVGEIKARLQRGEPYAIADEYGVSRAAVWQLDTGRTWRTVPAAPAASIAHIPVRQSMRGRCTPPEQPALQGEGNGRAVLTRAQALDALLRTLDGEAPEAVAEDYGVVRGTICAIRQRKTWRCLDEVIPARYRRMLAGAA